MAFQIGAALVPNMNEFISPSMLSPRMSPEVSYRHAQLSSRQNSTTGGVTTRNIFIDSPSSDYQYAASVVSVCVATTVYALQCTAGPSGVGSATCGPNAVTAIVTHGFNSYALFSAITVSSITVTAIETCVLAGTTAATCAATAKATGSGTTTTTSTTSTLTGTAYRTFDVAITAGASKLTENVNIPCATTTASAAVPSLTTKGLMIWALVGVFGAVAGQMLV